MDNSIIKLLSSIPIILIVLYFIPFLGICLILLRYFVHRNEPKYKISIILIVFGLLLLIPKLINKITEILKIDISKVPYIESILSSNLYTDLLKYSKLLITVGIALIIITYIFKNIYDKFSKKLSTSIEKYITNEEKKDYEIRQKNDLLMQEKREKAKNTHVVKCPHCGSDNILTERTGKCKHCRTPISYNEK